MTPRQIALVQANWRAIAPISATAADLFYERLFELDPSLRALFPTDLAEQKAKLMKTIGFAVAGLNNLESIVPAVQQLGIRHADYGVRDGHYNTVGAALLWTLARGLGDAFTPEAEAAWTRTYTLLADTMKRAAREAAAQAR